MPKLTYTTPPPSLMRELNEVAADAGALAAALASANRLPADFPAEPLRELLVELQSLPTGTAEGCRQPLEYARGRLPAIRRQFIRTEEESRGSPLHLDAPPPLTRGMTIDVQIGALVNSVTTALDEYRALASVQEDDAADTAPSITISATSPDVVDAMAKSRDAERRLGEGIEEIDRIARPESIAADNLRRQMRDTRRLLSLARIELRMPAFVPRWYRKTINTVSDYPQILRATAKTMLMGTDVARPLVDAWHHFEHGSYTLILDSLEHAAKGLLAVAKKWDMERAERKEDVTPNATAPPGDFNLATVHDLIIERKALSPEWRPWINALDFSNKQFLEDLAPLADVTALQSLNLSGTSVSDVSALSGLTTTRARS